MEHKRVIENRLRLRERDGDLCWICGLPLRFKQFGKVKHNHPMQASIDHVIPKSASGTYRLENLKLAHRYCNSHRQSGPVTDELKEQCRRYLMEHHDRVLSGLIKEHQVKSVSV